MNCLRYYKIKMKKCKVLGCSNSVMEIRESTKNESMKRCYGYCQIHSIEGLVELVEVRE